MYELVEIINNDISDLPFEERGKVTDGYHSFEELYAHRNNLFIALSNTLFHLNNKGTVLFKTKKDSEGKEVQKGWFLAGIYLETTYYSLISYHLPIALWDSLNVPETEKAIWHGETSEDVKNNLLKLF